MDMITAEELADRMKADILEDVIEGVVPRSVSSFSELHDYVDANTYGGTESLLDAATLAAPATDEGAHNALLSIVDLMNPAIEIVDAWIRQGGITRCLARDIPR